MYTNFNELISRNYENVKSIEENEIIKNKLNKLTEFALQILSSADDIQLEFSTNKDIYILNTLAIFMKNKYDEFNNYDIYQIVLILKEKISEIAKKTYDIDNVDEVEYELICNLFTSAYPINIYLAIVKENTNIEYITFKHENNFDSIFMLLYFGHYILLRIKNNNIINENVINDILKSCFDENKNENNDENKILSFDEFLNNHYQYNIVKYDKFKKIFEKLIFNEHIKLNFNIIRGDGNCFFNSIATWLIKNIYEYKSQNIDIIVKNMIDTIVPNVIANDMDNYVYDLNCPEYELLANSFVRLYNINIIVISINNENNKAQYFKYTNNSNTLVNNIFLLLHHAHFTLINIENTNEEFDDLEISNIIANSIN